MRANFINVQEKQKPSIQHEMQKAMNRNFMGDDMGRLINAHKDAQSEL